MLKTLMTTAALALLATSAHAQAPAQPAQPAPAADPTSDQIASWIAGRHGEVEGVDGQALQGGPQRDGQVHGAFGASIGSGGYKSGYGVATIPIGRRGDVTVGVSDEHLGGGARAYGRRGYGYGGGYGGERRSLSIGIDLTGERSGRPCPDRGLGDPAWSPAGPDLACPALPPASQPAR